MDVDTRIIERLQSLIELADKIPHLGIKHRKPGAVYNTIPVDPQPAYQWGTSCLNILGRVFGRESDHYKQFNSLFDHIDDYIYIKRALGVLQSAKDDYEHGYLFNVRILVEAEVFDDFLEQASYLLSQGYYQPAAVVVGSVLEDGLRKLCHRNGIVLSAKPKLDTMNAELAKAGIYNLLVQKRIIALADLRNKAAHGQWSEFTDQDVEQMLIQVRAFMEQYFT